MISDFIQSVSGGIVISILWGFALAMLFRRVCVDRECITVYGPKPSDMRDRVLKWDDKCYVFRPKEASCDDPGTTRIPVREN